jgi:endonuclease I
MIPLTSLRHAALHCVSFLAITLGTARAVTIVDYNLGSAPGNQVSNAPGTTPPNITGANLTRGAGLTASAASGSMSSTGWTGEATDYYEFGFDVAAGFQVALDKINLGTRSSGTGPGTTGVYSSVDNFVTPIATITQGNATVVSTIVDVAPLGNVTGNVRFRLKAIGTNSAAGGTTAAAGTLRITNYAGTPASNLLVTGTVSQTGGADSIPPVVISNGYSPADNATNVPITATPRLVFNEGVQKGTGNILIKRSSDNSIFESVAISSSQVVITTTTLTNDTLTVTPSASFANNTDYYVEIVSGVIKDLAGNNFAGISGATAWNFTTIAASVLPSATETFTDETKVTTAGASASTDFYAEGNGQGSFARYDVGTFNFTKLDFNLSGASTITGISTAELTLTNNDRTFSAGTEVEFFFTTDSSTGKTFNAANVNGIDNAQFTFPPISLGKFPYTPATTAAQGGVKNTFTLDLGAVNAALVSRLNTGENFSIIIAATTPGAAITYSGKGNTFDPGDPLLKLTVLETTGVDTTPPTVAFFTPADGSGGLPISSNLKVSFNELIQKGAGTITILRSGDNSVFETINVTSSQVSVNLGTVTIDPVGALESAGSYYVQISNGAIQDVSGNNFVGISDTTTWNFSTAQPPITAAGPFTISKNAPAGTVIGQLNSNINGKEGIKYEMLGGSGGATYMESVPGEGYAVNPIFTMGDTITGSTGAMNASSAGSFSPVGTPDGLGAFQLNPTTIRILMSHEIAMPIGAGLAGYAFTLTNGTVMDKGGARITYIDVDKTSRRVVDGGLAIARIYDRAGNVVTSTSQLDLGGLDRFCSASLYEPNLFGAGRGIVDRIYFAGEESGTGFGHPHGGTEWALDVATGDFWALPDFGRGEWENAAQVDTGTTTHVAFVMGDDTQGSPLYMYVGQKNPAGNFIERNGLKGGQLYVWKVTNGDLTPQQFNGTGAVRAGTWVAIAARVPANANTTGYDALGYKNDSVLASEADALGAFSFSRPEDVSTSPTDGTILAFNSTGRGNLFAADNWGDTYIVDIDFTNINAPTASVRILYDSDDRGGGQFATPEAGLRCQDNLDWADDGFIYIQEDQANQVGNFGAAGFDTSIWRMDPNTGLIKRVAMTDRENVLPLGSSDSAPTDVGNWESSGIVDVSTLFGEAAGTLFIFDVQAHSVTNGLISSKTLFEGGQLCFLERGIERGAFALNPNTGIITLANPLALDAVNQPSHELRLHAYDGTNHTLGKVTINVTTTAVATTNNFKAATFNTSHFRDADNTLINDLTPLTNVNSQKIARIIQRNNPDLILLNEFDYDAGGRAIKRFKENYLEVGQSGEAPVYYPYVFITPVNTGVHSGFDLDNNGSVVSTPGATGYGEDAFGFGTHPGEYGFVVLSKYPIDTANIRTFQKFLWKDMPGAMLPDNPNIAGTGDWYSPAELNVFRLSSKSHADVPVNINGTIVHALVSHPTPPVFDDPASGQPWIAGVDHNGRRNSDEIRFWNDYVNPANSTYIYDDTETSATAGGGLTPNARFIIFGDQNSDNNEGDGTDPAIKQLIGGVATVGGATIPANPLVNSTFVPGGGTGPQPDDTAAFSGGVRVDYVLPSVFGLTPNSGGVFWPGAGDPIVAALDATDHHMVFVNLTLTGVELPPNTDLITYYAPAQGLTGSTLQSALHNIIKNHVVIDYGTIDEVMQVIDEASPGSTQVRLLYSNATLPKTSNNIAGGWNREHVWPRSDGVGDNGPDYSDLHHLFPCKDTVNSLRSNDPYNVCADVNHDAFAPESHSNGSFWEPLDRDKGIVARAQLYMMTRYDGSEPLTEDLLLADNTAPTGTQGVLSTLLAWHKAFPPSDYERARNNAIYGGALVNGVVRAQGNRNPFIDFPQFVDGIFLTSPTTTSFSKWQLQKFTLAQLVGANTGKTADFDQDGFDNYSEFIFGTNPAASNTPPTVLAKGTSGFEFTYRRNRFVPASWTVQTSSTLTAGSWNNAVLNTDYELVSTVVDSGDSSVEYVTVRLLNPGAALFVRAQAVETP